MKMGDFSPIFAFWGRFLCQIYKFGNNLLFIVQFLQKTIYTVVQFEWNTKNIA
jgi:hypothetical protein